MTENEIVIQHKRLVDNIIENFLSEVKANNIIKTRFLSEKQKMRLINSRLKSEIKDIRKMYKKQIDFAHKFSSGDLEKPEAMRKIIKLDFFYINSSKSEKFKSDLKKYYSYILNSFIETQKEDLELYELSYLSDFNIDKLFEKGEVYYKNKREIDLKVETKIRLLPTIDYTDEVIRALRASEKTSKKNFLKRKKS